MQSTWIIISHIRFKLKEDYSQGWLNLLCAWACVRGHRHMTEREEQLLVVET